METTTRQAPGGQAESSAVPSAASSATAWGVIEAKGDDASAFLHGQLTQDVALLGSDQARLAALCNAKGRMLASMVVVKLAGDHVLLAIRNDMLAGVLKRLQMFVLRAKVKLSDQSAAWRVQGVLGRAVQGSVVGGSAAAWSRVDDADGAIWVRLPGAGPELARALILQRVATDEASASQSPAGRTGTPTAPSPAWLAAEILSGVAAVQPATIEAFVPQMLNYESVGGVSFKKGCYPGQEVVARSQFRGAIKRRACVVESGVALQAGQEIVDASDPGEACGVVAQAAIDPSQPGRWLAIVCALTTAIEAQALAVHIAAPEGAAADDAAPSIVTPAPGQTPVRLRVLPLPYGLLTDI